MVVWRVRTSAGLWLRTEGREIEEVDLMPLLLFKPTRNYTRSSRKEGLVSLLSLVLIRISEVSAHTCHQPSCVEEIPTPATPFSSSLSSCVSQMGEQTQSVLGV